MNISCAPSRSRPGCGLRSARSGAAATAASSAGAPAACCCSFCRRRRSARGRPICIPATRRKARVAHAVEEDDAWVEGQSLIGTVEDVELIDPDLSGERLLYRLFHERGVRVFTPLPLRAQCSCSRDAVSAMLKSFAPKDRAEMVKDGKVVVTCEFCSSVYEFTPEEAGVDVGERVSAANRRAHPRRRVIQHSETSVIERRSHGVLDTAHARAMTPVMRRCRQPQFNTRFVSGLSSENVGTSISNRSPLSLTIW